MPDSKTWGFNNMKPLMKQGRTQSGTVVIVWAAVCLVGFFTKAKIS